MKTESFKVEGLSVENELMQVITSDIGVYGKLVLRCYMYLFYTLFKLLCV